MSSSDMLSAFSTNKTEGVSLATLIGTLVVSGVSVLVWMGIDGWKDLIGVSVAIIFLAIAVLQVVFAVWWVRSLKKQQKYVGVQTEVDFENQHKNAESQLETKIQ